MVMDAKRAAIRRETEARRQEQDKADAAALRAAITGMTNPTAEPTTNTTFDGEFGNGSDLADLVITGITTTGADATTTEPTTPATTTEAIAPETPTPTAKRRRRDATPTKKKKPKKAGEPRSASRPSRRR